jgi:hypothetical protein
MIASSIWGFEAMDCGEAKMVESTDSLSTDSLSTMNRLLTDAKILIKPTAGI